MPKNRFRLFGTEALLDAGAIRWLEWRHASLECASQLGDDLDLAFARGDLVLGVEEPGAVEEAREVGTSVTECAPQVHVQELCGEECRLVRVGYGTAEGEHVAGVGHSLLEGTSDGAHTVGGRGHALPCEEVRCCKFDAVF